jgi:hypothetical protein
VDEAYLRTSSSGGAGLILAASDIDLELGMDLSGYEQTEGLATGPTPRNSRVKIGKGSQNRKQL